MPRRRFKTCSRCDLSKPLSEFPRSRRSPDGRYYYCYECHAVRSRAWRSENPEKARDSAQRWRDNNPYKVGVLGRRSARIRRERLGAVEREPFTPLEIYLRDQGTCGLCGEYVPLEETSIDHITPVSRGGTDMRANVQLAHLKCNRAKGARVEESVFLSMFLPGKVTSYASE